MSIVAVSAASNANPLLNNPQYREENRPRKLTNVEKIDIIKGLPDVHGSNDQSIQMATRSVKASILKQLNNIKITPLSLENGEFQTEIYRQFKASLIRSGTMVGLNATDAISAPIMQMTLNTFHTAGAAKNVTGGFEAVKGLIKGSTTPKNPSCTISFKNKHLSFDDILDIKQPELIGLVASRPIVDWDILSQTELFGMNIVHPYWYNISSTVLGKRIPTPQQSHWILRLTVSVDIMYRFRITAKELSDSIEEGSPEMITCIYSPIVWREDVQTVVDDVGNVIEEKIEVATVYIDIFPEDDQISDVGKLNVSTAGRENIGMIFLEAELKPSLDQIRVKGVPGIENIFPAESPVWQVVENEIDTRDQHPNLWKLEYNMFRINVSGITGENVVKLCQTVGMDVHNPSENMVQVVVPDKISYPDFDEVAKIEYPKDYITPGELVRYWVNKDRADTRAKELENREERNRLLVEDPRKGIRFVTQVPTTDIFRDSHFVYADTNGSNMRELMNRDDIDPYHTYSNNMYDILTILGVEAARNYLIWSLNKMFINSGQYVDIRHTMLLIDYMTFSGGVTKATFSGVRNHGAVLTTASYQQGMKTMANAALYGDFDPGDSITASIFTGKTPDIGPDIEITDQMKAKIYQMYNGADSGEPITIDPDDLDRALQNQDEIAGRADTTFGGATIPTDENDALMNAMFDLGDMPDEFIPSADIETRRREESSRREEQPNIFGQFNIGKPEPIKNEAIAEIVDNFVQSGEEIPCEQPTIDFVKIEGLEHGIRTEGLPSDDSQLTQPSTPKLTQNTVSGIPVPKVGINVPENIGIPPDLQQIIQRGLSLQFSQVSGISDIRSSERTVDLIELVRAYYKGSPINIDNYLDVGCGSGEITKEVSRALNIKNSYGADVENQTCPNFILVQDNKINLPDNSIDLITAYVTLHHFSNYDGMVRELVRVARNNGLLFIREHDSSNEHQAYLDMVHMIEAIGRGENMIDYLRTFVSSYWSKNDLIKSLGEYGFDYVSERTYPSNIPNPQHLYHALFVRNENNQVLNPYNPIVAKSNYQLDKYNMITWIKQEPAPYYDQVLRYIRKKLGINKQRAVRIIKRANTDIELYQLLGTNKK